MGKSRADNWAEPNQRSVELADWENVVGAFHYLFNGLGNIRQDGDRVSFTSKAPDVATGLTLRKDGELSGSMPLHGVRASVRRLRWDDARTWVQLEGDNITYTYRIPHELLRHRVA